jgi:phosphoglycolate phosphatase-like HAD superfamily hydrolase
MKLILFDIDGTLISTGLAGSDAMQWAFAELYNIPNAFAGIEMSGRTDPAILYDALTAHNIASHEHAAHTFHECYIPHLRRALQQPERQRRLMPGFPALLDLLAARDDLILGLLTGNFAMGAQLKLESFALWQYFRLGAYGSDHHDRNALVPVAQQRLQTLLGHAIPGQQTYVIGDTPRDIACARAHGACAIAVATGSYSVEALQQHQPDYCFVDLSDTAQVVRILLE